MWPLPMHCNGLLGDKIDDLKSFQVEKNGESLVGNKNNKKWKYKKFFMEFVFNSTELIRQITNWTYRFYLCFCDIYSLNMYVVFFIFFGIKSLWLFFFESLRREKSRMASIGVLAIWLNFGVDFIEWNIHRLPFGHAHVIDFSNDGFKVTQKIYNFETFIFGAVKLFHIHKILQKIPLI